MLDLEEEELFLVTNGGVVTDTQQKVVWPGDVIDGKTLSRLLESFDFAINTTLLYITK